MNAAEIRTVAASLSPTLRIAMLSNSAAAAHGAGTVSDDDMEQLNLWKLWVLRNGVDGYGYYETKLGQAVTRELRKAI